MLPHVPSQLDDAQLAAAWQFKGAPRGRVDVQRCAEGGAIRYVVKAELDRAAETDLRGKRVRRSPTAA